MSKSVQVFLQVSCDSSITSYRYAKKVGILIEVLALARGHGRINIDYSKHSPSTSGSKTHVVL